MVVWTWEPGGGGVRWIGRVTGTYIHFHVRNRQLVRSCCIAQGAQLRLAGDLDRWDRGS